MNIDYKSIIYCFVAVLMLALVARPASAGTPYDKMGMLYMSVDAGWEMMQLNDDVHAASNHGLSTTLSVGANLFYFLGLQIDQDLGFMEVRRTDLNPKKELLFKGGTFVSLPVFSPDTDPLVFQAKIGIGGIYMEAPKDAEKSVQSWFAFRPTIAVLWLSDSYGGKGIGVGLEFGYTFACAKSNLFDHRNIVHFFDIKAKFMLTR